MPNTNTPPNKKEAGLKLNISEKQEVVKEDKAPTSIKQIYESINNWLIDQSTISTQEKLLFFQLLGSMINAGMPITDSLYILQKETENLKLKMIIRDMKSDIEEGESLADAMKKFPDVFDTATCSVIEAGEKSGQLNHIIKELVSQYSRLFLIQEKVKSVTTYPKVVFGVMVLAAVIVVIFVVPKLKELFGGAGNLPLPTRILLTISDIVREFGFILLLIFVVLFALFKYWSHSPAGKKQMANIMLSAPIISEVLRNMILVRVTRIFGFLISAGVPIIDSLKISANIAESQIYKEKLLLAADDLSKGIMIAENISDDPKLFPSMLVSMMSIGEKTATLDKAMSKVAQFYDEDLDRKIQNMSKLMEPIIMILIAIGVGFMIAAIYLPILQMNDKILG